MFSAEEENERRPLAFRRLCHLVEGASWCGERPVGRGRHDWSSLTETRQLSVTSVTFCVRLFYHFTATWFPLSARQRQTPYKQIVQNVLGTNTVTVLPWPACSPDTSPLEHLGDAMDSCVRQHTFNQPTKGDSDSPKRTASYPM